MKRSFLSPFTAFAVVVVAVLASAAVIAHAAPADDSAFEAAFQAFAKASAGDDSAVDAAAAAFEALRKAAPDNPVLTAYAGASTAMQARTVQSPFKKMSLAEDGLAGIDRSLAMLAPPHDAPIERGVPGVLEVRFVAANTFLGVPSFMNRGARGHKLLDEVLASPLFATAPLPFRGNVWLRAAELAVKEQRLDDARRLAGEIISREAPQSARARQLLKGLSA